MIWPGKKVHRGSRTWTLRSAVLEADIFTLGQPKQFSTMHMCTHTHSPMLWSVANRMLNTSLYQNVRQCYTVYTNAKWWSPHIPYHQHLWSHPHIEKVLLDLDSGSEWQSSPHLGPVSLDTIESRGACLYAVLGIGIGIGIGAAFRPRL